MNLSSKELSALERSGLEKGLKFAIAPRKIPTAEIVAAVEESISQLNDDRRHLVRAEVSSILRRAKPPPKNIQKDVFNALIALKKDPDRLVWCPVVSIQSRFDTSRFDTNRSRFVTHVKSIRCKLKAFGYK